ncbi:hypothetical protein BDV95DRAFT_496467 [Massariosphaeria phaeospora]|uniref:Necrosis inducing protein-domain-containing protein n=1 Tax=Massariosphaeria phaeospora TaxID=100035 RepID=A0A7C8M6L0_9PLEO|nr:hypothetical protein BDV95DRAFT_496467 [Massariosphaeria phaeospora]
MKFLLFLAQLVALATALATPPAAPADDYLPCGIPWPVAPNFAKAAVDNPGSNGVATIFGNNNGPRPWARNRNNLFVIRYCYAREYDRQNVQGTVEWSINNWYHHLGGPASKKSGHGIVFQEALNSANQPFYCYKKGAPNDWNLNVQYNTVVIEYTYGGGMVHEHQRPDRDTYLSFDCQKLGDFKYALDNARITDPTITWWELCNDLKLAYKYKFRGFEYVKGKALHQDWTVRPVGFFDHDSIMIYGTETDMGPECDPNTGHDCALSRWKDKSNHGMGVEKQNGFQETPSTWDIRWLKLQYPWKDPPKKARGDDDGQ